MSEQKELANAYGYKCKDCTQPGSSVHGILQEKYWSGLSCPSPRDLPNPGIEPESLTHPALADGFFTTSTTWEIPEEG